MHGQNQIKLKTLLIKLHTHKNKTNKKKSVLGGIAESMFPLKVILSPCSVGSSDTSYETSMNTAPSPILCHSWNIHNPTKLIPYEELFIQTFHHHSNLISEQSAPEPNPLFQMTFDTT